MSEANASQKPQGPVIPVKPSPNIYTVLIYICVLALAISVVIVLWRMTGEMPDGYGLPMKHIFQPNTPLPGPAGP
jgi:hypothetical protein